MVNDALVLGVVIRQSNFKLPFPLRRDNHFPIELKSFTFQFFEKSQRHKKEVSEADGRRAKKKKCQGSRNIRLVDSQLVGVSQNGCSFSSFLFVLLPSHFPFLGLFMTNLRCIRRRRKGRLIESQGREEERKWQ